jgi:hypothetical protein
MFKFNRLNSIIKFIEKIFGHSAFLRKYFWHKPSIAEFERIAIPLVRRIYPSLIASQIVSVQPLTAPTGLVHYIRYRYSKNSKNTYIISDTPDCKNEECFDNKIDEIEKFDDFEQIDKIEE